MPSCVTTGDCCGTYSIEGICATLSSSTMKIATTSVFLYTFSDGLVDANAMLHAKFTRCTFTIFHADNKISLYIYFDLLISCIFRFLGITY